MEPFILGVIVGTCGGILFLAYERDQEQFLAGTTDGVIRRRRATLCLPIT